MAAHVFHEIYLTDWSALMRMRKVRVEKLWRRPAKAGSIGVLFQYSVHQLKLVADKEVRRGGQTRLASDCLT